MKDKEQLIILFRKYLADQHTEAELDEILRYFQLLEHDDQLVRLIEQELEQPLDADTSLVTAIGEQVAHSLFQQTRPATVHKLNQWLRYAAAMLLCGVIGVGIYQYTRETDIPAERPLMAEHIIQPGGNRATITLDNGQTLTLSEDQGGIINKDEVLTYADGSAIKGLEAVQLVTLATPRAGQYTVTLSDGTKVWLNAASELIYPTHFDKAERSVQVRGEAYFEVARDPKRPFIVRTDKQQISVLGTTFNIHAYADETVQHTTLVEGAVMIENLKDQKSFRLNPGQQAVSKAGDVLSILQVDPQEYVSWKNGIIILNSYDLPEILRQLERWYDVEFGAIPAGIKSAHVFGMIKRDVPLNDVLKTLSDNYSTIQFKINGRRITMETQ